MSLSRCFQAGLVVLFCVGCGGPKKLQVKQVKQEAAPTTGPKATAEEVEGEVPPLRGLADAIPLVPEKLVPPEPPADPEPTFE